MEICDVGLQCWNLTLPKNASLDIKVSIWDLRYSKNGVDPFYLLINLFILIELHLISSKKQSVSIGMSWPTSSASHSVCLHNDTGESKPTTVKALVINSQQKMKHLKAFCKA